MHTRLNEFVTPVLPVVKSTVPGQQQARLRVRGDYFVTANHHLQTHLHSVPLPKDLMRNIGGGYYFTKINLADAYSPLWNF